MNRRGFLRHSAAAVALTAGTRSLARTQGPSGPDDLIENARARASLPFSPDQAPLPPPFDALGYDSYRGIRPLPGLSAQIPLGHGFEGDLLPPGWLFRDSVAITLPGDNAPRSVDPELFGFDPRYFPDPHLGTSVPDTPSGAGFSGMRLRYPLDDPARHDDLLVLQGASYFRALVTGSAYGLSARGLSIGTGGASPEEFPVTRQIVVFGTEPGAIHLGCLIDSPRAAAALIIRMAPRAGETVMNCDLHLFARETLTDVGIAPLTSMFQHSDLGPAAIDDFRPAVHDSDALLIDNGAGERLWRPLSNPATVQMSAFADADPRRFGLLQTPTAFAHFRDAEGAYHRRPSALVEPSGDWGPGNVMLLEIPTQDEYADNIVAFWRPTAPLEPGLAHRFTYRLRWLPPGSEPIPPGAQYLPWLPLRSASGIEPVSRQGRLFVLDFSHPEHASVPDGLTLDIVAGPGVLIDGEALYPLPDGGLRASFILTPDAGTESADIRLRLHAGGDALGGGRLVAPVWLFRWTRAKDGGP
jgi:periplasmic glucans biosynthesis protein